MGSLDSAKYCYELALYNRTDYPFALAGLARIEKTNANYKAAIGYLIKANEQITEYSFYEDLAELYLLDGQKLKSDSATMKAIEMLSPGENDNEEVAGHGHYADRELALVYSKKGEHLKAMQHAITEYNRRPNNIDVCETLAWIYYKAGKFYLADAVMKKAARTGKRNPETLCRRGLIQLKVGQNFMGRKNITDALQMNPFLDAELKSEATSYLQM